MPLIHDIAQLSAQDQTEAQRILQSPRPVDLGSLPRSSQLGRYVPIIDRLIQEASLDLDYVDSAVFMEDPVRGAKIIQAPPPKVWDIPKEAFRAHPQLLVLAVQNAPHLIESSHGGLPDDLLSDAVLAAALGSEHQWVLAPPSRPRSVERPNPIISTILGTASPDFWTLERAQQCARCAPQQLGSLPEQFRALPSVIQEALTSTPAYYKTLPFELKKHEDIARTALGLDGMLLEYAPLSIQQSKEHVMAALHLDGGAYVHADESVQCQADVALFALKNMETDVLVSTFPKMPLSLRSDTQWCHQVLDVLPLSNPYFQTALLIAHIDPTVLDDRHFVRRACAVDLSTMVAVHQHRHGGLWQFEDLSAQLVAGAPSLLKAAPPELRTSGAFYDQVLSHDPQAPGYWRALYAHMHQRVGVDVERACTFVQKDPSVYQMLPQQQRAQVRVIEAALSHAKLRSHDIQDVAQYIPQSTLEQDPSVQDVCIRAALRTHYQEGGDFKVTLIGTLKVLIGEEQVGALEHDALAAKDWVQRYPALYPWAPAAVRVDPVHFERFLAEPHVNARSSKYPDCFQSDVPMALKALDKDPMFYFNFEHPLRTNPTVAFAFATTAPADRFSLPEKLKTDLDFLMKVCQARGDDLALGRAAGALKGQITRVQNQLHTDKHPVTFVQAAKHLHAKRTAHTEQKALKTTVAPVRAPVKRSASAALGRSL
jgi:hypothetical protein